jgi:acetyl-CoA carboxylase biotin carboxyl carrier protein
MRVDQIKRLVELVEKSEIEELEVREWGRSIRIAKGRSRDVAFTGTELQVPAPAAPQPTIAAEPASGGDTPEVVASDAGLVPILSPMVGTFYRAASPTAAPFIDAGARVASGQTVCIIEAMKLMNEIESEVDGTIVEVLLKNEEPVEFNQPLFMVRPD